MGVGGEDLSGGYFDAGDFMKFNFPLTWSLTNLGKLVKYNIIYVTYTKNYPSMGWNTIS